LVFLKFIKEFSKFWQDYSFITSSKNLLARELFTVIIIYRFDVPVLSDAKNPTHHRRGA